MTPGTAVAPAPQALRDEDAERLAALHRRCFPEEAWTAESFAALLAMPGCHGWLTTEDDSPDSPLTALLLARRAADEAEILTLCVSPEHRRQALAKRLVGCLIETLSQGGTAALHLEVAVNNRAARALYGGFGFVEIGRRPDYYKDETQAERVDACMLRLELCA